MTNLCLWSLILSYAIKIFVNTVVNPINSTSTAATLAFHAVGGYPQPHALFAVAPPVNQVQQGAQAITNSRVITKLVE